MLPAFFVFSFLDEKRFLVNLDSPQSSLKFVTVVKQQRWLAGLCFVTEELQFWAWSRKVCPSKSTNIKAALKSYICACLILGGRNGEKRLERLDHPNAPFICVLAHYTRLGKNRRRIRQVNGI